MPGWALSDSVVTAKIIQQNAARADMRATRFGAPAAVHDFERSGAGCLPRAGRAERGMISFASDNAAPAAPEVLAAIAAANQGMVHSYGDDPWTKALGERARAVFGRRARDLSGRDRHRRQRAGARDAGAALWRGALP